MAVGFTLGLMDNGMLVNSRMTKELVMVFKFGQTESEVKDDKRTGWSSLGYIESNTIVNTRMTKKWW